MWVGFERSGPVLVTRINSIADSKQSVVEENTAWKVRANKQLICQMISMFNIKANLDFAGLSKSGTNRGIYFLFIVSFWIVFEQCCKGGS